MHSNGIYRTGLLTVREENLDGTAASKLSANLYDVHHCCVYSEKLPMMDRRTVRNMYSLIPKIDLRN